MYFKHPAIKDYFWFDTGGEEASAGLVYTLLLETLDCCLVSLWSNSKDESRDWFAAICNVGKFAAWNRYYLDWSGTQPNHSKLYQWEGLLVRTKDLPNKALGPSPSFFQSKASRSFFQPFTGRVVSLQSCLPLQWSMANQPRANSEQWFLRPCRVIVKNSYYSSSAKAFLNWSLFRQPCAFNMLCYNISYENRSPTWLFTKQSQKPTRRNCISDDEDLNEPEPNQQ